VDLTTFRTELRTRLGVPNGDAFFTDAVCTQLVNAGLHLVETEADWPWLEATEAINTAAGIENYQTAANALRTVTVRGPNSIVLERAPILEIERMNGTGSPRYYAPFGAQLIVRPVPVAIEALVHRYIRTEPDLAGGADVPLLPASYHSAVVEAAAMFAFRREGRANDAQAARVTFDDWIAQMRRRASRRSDDPGGGETAGS